MVIMLNKPTGYTCSHRDQGALIYELLPPRFSQRKPPLSSVGRLDKETSGLLLLTDDGQLLHRLTSPKRHIPKVYEARLAEALRGTERELFASGTMILPEEEAPLKPAQLEDLGEKHVRLTIEEGKYHQIRRMFAAVDNTVTELKRIRIGELTLDGLREGDYRILSPDEIDLALKTSPAE
jgi:16S rRNA pseudouridine516 synthase